MPRPWSEQIVFDTVEVNPLTLGRAAQTWLEQSQGASQAATAVADANTAGFDPEVQPDLATFLATWSAVAKQISSNVDDVSTGLAEFRNRFGLFETQVSNDLNPFGFGGKPGLS